MQRGQHSDSLAVMGMVESAVVGGGIGIVTGGATGYCFARVTERTIISRGDILELAQWLENLVFLCFADSSCLRLQHIEAEFVP